MNGRHLIPTKLFSAKRFCVAVVLSLAIVFISLPISVCSCSCDSGCCSTVDGANQCCCCSTQSEESSSVSQSCCCTTLIVATPKSNCSDCCDCGDDCECNCDCEIQMWLPPAVAKTVVVDSEALPLARLAPIYELKPETRVIDLTAHVVQVSTIRVHALCSVWLN